VSANASLSVDVAAVVVTETAREATEDGMLAKARTVVHLAVSLQNTVDLVVELDEAELHLHPKLVASKPVAFFFSLLVHPTEIPHIHLIVWAEQ